MNERLPAVPTALPARVRPVRLAPAPDVEADTWLHQACDGIVVGDVPAAVALASRLTDLAPQPGEGRTTARWELLATLGAADLTTARVAEAHLDAMAILSEAPAPAPGAPVASTWGVFAAEAAGLRVDAREAAGRWVLDGTKPWCSLGGTLSHALITAHTQQGRRLFAVALQDGGVRADTDAWRSRGLADVPSGPLHLRSVAATPVGAAGWYLRRPGFAYGGIGVAACWYGGAVGLARSLAAAARRREPDDIALWHLGAVDVALQRARALLHEAAGLVDDGRATGAAGAVLALRVRAAVTATAEQVLTAVGHALGPAPLALDDEHARRVADLTVYLRQQHAERDDVALGRMLLADDRTW
ncbi:MAG TPA: hypothetical protein VF661_12575 [Actinomycetales bacterium]|jgi:hypothetical protein